MKGSGNKIGAGKPSICVTRLAWSGSVSGLSNWVLQRDVTIGFSIDEQTGLRVQCPYYRAAISQAIRVVLESGRFCKNDETFGCHNNDDGHTSIIFEKK